MITTETIQPCQGDIYDNLTTELFRKYKDRIGLKQLFFFNRIISIPTLSEGHTLELESNRPTLEEEGS